MSMSAWVFTARNGASLDGDNVRKRVFQPALVRTKLRQIRIHDLRHTYASLLIQQGESLAYVRDQLGHSSIQVTVDIYGHRLSVPMQLMQLLRRVRLIMNFHGHRTAFLKAQQWTRELPVVRNGGNDMFRRDFDGRRSYMQNIICGFLRLKGTWRERRVRRCSVYGQRRGARSCSQ